MHFHRTLTHQHLRLSSCASPQVSPMESVTELAILLFGLEAPLVVGERQREGEKESKTSQVAGCEQGSPGRKSRKTASSTETFHATPTRRCVAEFRGWNFLFSFPFCPVRARHQKARQQHRQQKVSSNLLLAQPPVLSGSAREQTRRIAGNKAKEII